MARNTYQKIATNGNNSFKKATSFRKTATSQNCHMGIIPQKIKILEKHSHIIDEYSQYFAVAFFYHGVSISEQFSS